MTQDQIARRLIVVSDAISAELARRPFCATLSDHGKGILGIVVEEITAAIVANEITSNAQKETQAAL